MNALCDPFSGLSQILTYFFLKAGFTGPNVLNISSWISHRHLTLNNNNRKRVLNAFYMPRFILNSFHVFHDFLKIEGQLPQGVSFLFLESVLCSSFKTRLALPSLREAGLFPWGAGCLSSSFLQHSVSLYLSIYDTHSFIHLSSEYFLTSMCQVGCI